MATSTRPSLLSRPSPAGIGLVALALLEVLNRYVRILISDNTLWDDAATVWLPLARRVAGGTPLYVAPAVDNKPPLWQYLNLAVYETGAYTPVFYLLVGLANGVAAWLLYRWVSDFARDATGAVAALLFLAALPIVNGTIINIRSVALVFVLAAVQARRAGTQGALLALGGLITQYAVLGIPVALWYRHAQGGLDARAFTRFVAAGLGVVVLGFAPLLWWGVPSLVGGIEWSFGVGSGQLSGHGQLVSWVGPVQWGALLVMVAMQLLAVLVPAALFVGGWLFGGRDISTTAFAVAGYAGAYGLALGVKSLKYYWLLTLPFLAALAALEVESLYQRAA